MHKKRVKLNRFTSLPVLLDMLGRRKLVLLDPKTWEDKNDSEAILEYKKRKKLKSLFVLCLSEGDETIHHWRTFADGISGCCIEFDRQRLEAVLGRQAGVRFGKVRYRKLTDLTTTGVTSAHLPFTKRWPYRCEAEYRILWESRAHADEYEIDLDLHLIRRITISQRMPARVYETIRASLIDVFRKPDKRINRSTLYENKKWIEGLRRHP
jgi:hypothetical protein